MGISQFDPAAELEFPKADRPLSSRRWQRGVDCDQAAFKFLSKKAVRPPTTLLQSGWSTSPINSSMAAATAPGASMAM